MVKEFSLKCLRYAYSPNSNIYFLHGDLFDYATRSQKSHIFGFLRSPKAPIWPKEWAQITFGPKK